MILLIRDMCAVKHAQMLPIAARRRKHVALKLKHHSRFKPLFRKAFSLRVALHKQSHAAALLIVEALRRRRHPSIETVRRIHYIINITLEYRF